MEAAKKRAAKYGKGSKKLHPRMVKNRPAGKRIMKTQCVMAVVAVRAAAISGSYLP